MNHLFLFLSLAAAQSPDGGTLQPMSAVDAVALFKRVCVDPFPDPARFETALAAEDDTYQKTPKTPEQAMQPGDSYYSNRAQFGYAAADWLPRDLPSPQCALTVRLDAAPDHPAIASATAAAIGLPPGKTSGKGRIQTQWDVGAPGGKFRYFMTTSPALADTYQLRITLLNLRGKK
jgi:hypothetical protein